jgi:transposase
MATERLPMLKLREILRHKLQLGSSHREAAAALGISAGSVGGAATRAAALGLDWPAVCALDDETLEVRLYGPRGGWRDGRPIPDLVYVHTELRRVGVTLELLHLEYLEQFPEGFRYTKFCELYREWRKRRAATMRQIHVAGDKSFVDYSGKKPHIVDPVTGEQIEVELFVAVLGASSYTYAEATFTQQLPDWIGSNQRAFEFFGGVTRAVVPDQLKCAVTKACRYDPQIQRTFDEFATHYGTTVLPARPAKPRDKAKVEVAVQVAQRWILARLRNQVFFSLDELNARIRELLDDLNNREMRVYHASRRELFERLERAVLRPLPGEPYDYAEWRRVTLNVDYHAVFEDHFYSAPHTLLHEELWLRAAAATIRIFHGGKQVALHARSWVKFGHTTKNEHMPLSHREHAEWTPGRILHWAEGVGQNTALLTRAIIEEKPHPEHGYRSCLGIIRLAKKYGNDRVDAACARAYLAGARSYRHVASILRHGLDRAPALEIAPGGPGPALSHQNIRGRDYYH